ncbi:hypothetical protein SNK03_001706 [Fusarium graminearum]|uniref:Chromosome 1, complete genome n=2 Tax=Gibberella zeae TaxID=5518 RepID=I1RD05_GIBZE|nr:hypothetical protein FGSG_01492 [Fusarium graminearum PH-1]EYB27268.1 hypothetical protein FG05_01492 [Fusarium graminearum]ESU06816.1 hypothetical protein FGSG_01492 [Fusarium graminearum PH-1]CAF3598978.1 unnamed protein product [Fusarium graminearum]CAG1983899.1 unnamed protein product [Fusarium graminearum]CEF73635.1 unnamed protein product [Fusarium graminearum]|eukprot:XP_011317301.1 hypothetical protein FGSG_01492 [Fusarium graminearum PH-1]
MQRLGDNARHSRLSRGSFWCISIPESEAQTETATIEDLARTRQDKTHSCHLGNQRGRRKAHDDRSIPLGHGLEIEEKDTILNWPKCQGKKKRADKKERPEFSVNSET